MAIDCSRFVEAHLNAIKFQEAEQVIEIEFRHAGGFHSTMSLRGACRLVVFEMRETNIVDRLTIWNSDQFESDPNDTLALLIGNESFDQVKTEFMPLLEEAKASIRSGEQVLVEIEPVYGAHVIALAPSLSVTSY